MVFQTSDYLEDVSFIVADDNSYMRRVIIQVLQTFGARMIDEVRDGDEALEVLRTNLNDIIITEWHMSPVDGIDLLKAVRAQDNELKFTPMIMCTSMTTHSNIIECRNAGVTEVVAKPISATALFLRIREVIVRPRPFVDASNYFGPDRRRRVDGPQDGKDKRGMEPSSAPSADQDRNLSQEEIDQLVAGDSISVE